MARRSLKNSFIEVILLTFDKNLGEKYDIVKVKPIFARNVLLPKGIAILATAMNVHNYAVKINAAKKEKEDKVTSLYELFAKIAQDDGIAFAMKANDRGVLYEKIDAAHIIKKINETYKVSLQENIVKMKKKITTLGEHIVVCKYLTVEKDLRVVVKSDKNADVVETVAA
jgi:large subunit ribosomal protein L9